MTSTPVRPTPIASRLPAALLCPRAFTYLPDHVELRETHVSWVFLVETLRAVPRLLDALAATLDAQLALGGDGSAPDEPSEPAAPARAARGHAGPDQD